MSTERLSAGSAVLEVDPEDGGRWTSLRVDGLELLSGSSVDGVPRGVQSGCFVMAPYAGRLGHGRLTWRGRTWQLPVDAPPHAIHGHVFDVPWSVTAPGVLAARLADPWPFRGQVEQHLDLAPDRLHVRVVLRAEDAMPAVLGLHPWFARRLARGGDVALHVEPRRMYAQSADSLPTGELADPPGGPYDDCFVGMAAPPRLVWPGALELTITSSADHWVVFDQLPDVVCVEPQTGPPDAVALGEATVVPAGGELVLEASFAWR
jgi:aldose 1-epimerase